MIRCRVCSSKAGTGKVFHVRVEKRRSDFTTVFCQVRNIEVEISAKERPEGSLTVNARLLAMTRAFNCAAVKKGRASLCPQAQRLLTLTVQALSCTTLFCFVIGSGTKNLSSTSIVGYRKEKFELLNCLDPKVLEAYSPNDPIPGILSRDLRKH